MARWNSFKQKRTRDSGFTAAGTLGGNWKGRNATGIGTGGNSGSTVGSEISDGWPKPQPLGWGDPPALDLNLLPGWAGDFAGSLSYATETPPELSGALVLAACSAIASRCVQVAVHDGYSEPTNIWIVAALPSGSRKSAVQSRVTAPLSHWEHEQRLRVRNEIAKATSDRAMAEERVKALRRRAARAKSDAQAAELARQARDIEMQMPEVPVPPKLWLSDVTQERLAPVLLEQRERIAWFSSEGGLFDLLAGRYTRGIPNLDLVLKSYSGDAERVERGSRPPVNLTNPLLTIGLSPQPEVLSGLAATPEFRGRGLLGRFLYLLPASNLGYRTLEPRRVASEVESTYHRGLTSMLGWPEGARPVTLAESAHQLWLEFAREVEQAMRPGGRYEHCHDWAGKAPGNAARVAGVLHCIEHAFGCPWEVSVSSRTMQCALDFMRIVSEHTLMVMDQMGAGPEMTAARDVLDWIRNHGSSIMTVSEIHQAMKGRRYSVGSIRSALAVLEEHGIVRMDSAPRKGPGRPPSPLVRVNPYAVPARADSPR